MSKTDRWLVFIAPVTFTLTTLTSLSSQHARANGSQGQILTLLLLAAWPWAPPQAPPVAGED